MERRDFLKKLIFSAGAISVATAIPVLSQATEQEKLEAYEYEIRPVKINGMVVDGVDYDDNSGFNDKLYKAAISHNKKKKLRKEFKKIQTFLSSNDSARNINNYMEHGIQPLHVILESLQSRNESKTQWVLAKLIPIPAS